MTMPTPPADPNAGPAPAAPAAPTPPPAPATQAPTAPPTPAPQNQPPSPAAPAVPQPPTWTPPQPPSDDDGIDELSKLPKKWQKEILDLRNESAKYRTSARTETVLRHAYTTATEHGVNPAALLGSTAFANVAGSLDPNSEDFPAKLADAIKNALTANPWMSAAQATPAPPPPPAVSGGEFTGAPGEGAPITEEQLSRMSPEEIASALAAGKLKHLL